MRSPAGSRQGEALVLNVANPPLGSAATTGMRPLGALPCAYPGGHLGIGSVGAMAGTGVRRAWRMTAAWCGFLALLPAGCSRGHPHTIAVVPRRRRRRIWEAEHAGVAKALLGTGWKERWNGPSSETEVDRQIALVQQAIRQRDGGLILAPDHPLALTTAVRRAAEQGMPVVVVDATLSLPSSLDVDYLMNDERQTGELAADRIGDILHGHGTVAVLGETPALMGTVARAEAFRRLMEARYPGITVLDPLPG